MYPTETVSVLNYQQSAGLEIFGDPNDFRDLFVSEIADEGVFVEGETEGRQHPLKREDLQIQSDHTSKQTLRNQCLQTLGNECRSTIMSM